MKIEKRQVQYLNRKAVYQLDENNQKIDGTKKLYEIVDDVGTVYEEGTLIDQNLLNTINWKDNDCIMFDSIPSGKEVPEGYGNKTVIYSKNDGELWVIPNGNIDKQFRIDIKDIDVSNLVTKDTTQIITGDKKFYGLVSLEKDLTLNNSKSIVLKNNFGKRTSLYLNNDGELVEEIENGVAYKVAKETDNPQKIVYTYAMNNTGTSIYWLVANIRALQGIPNNVPIQFRIMNLYDTMYLYSDSNMNCGVSVSYRTAGMTTFSSDVQTDLITIHKGFTATITEYGNGTYAIVEYTSLRAGVPCTCVAQLTLDNFIGKYGTMQCYMNK